MGGFAGLAQPHRDALHAAASAVRAAGAIPAPIRQGFASSMLSAAFAARSPEACAEVTAWLDVCPPLPFADEVDAAVASPDLTPLLSSLRTPLLALCGDQDAAVPLPYSQHLAATVPGARLEVFAGCGHALLIEDPARTIASVRMGLGLD
jgi:pimeloyl-ACP methyl ester carboxylesterase